MLHLELYCRPNTSKDIFIGRLKRLCFRMPSALFDVLRGLDQPQWSRRHYCLVLSCSSPVTVQWNSANSEHMAFAKRVVTMKSSGYKRPNEGSSRDALGITVTCAALSIICVRSEAPAVFFWG
jgi:uncharacterized membrane protein